MVTRKTREEEDDGGAGTRAADKFASTVRDSAQQIWLAGLGAFSKAQEEGGKVFEALVKEGLGMQRKTQAAAEDKLSEATSRMAAMANELSSRATGSWDKLEGLFEERVGRALRKLGVPSADDVQALTARVEELQRAVARMEAAGRRGGRTAAKSPAQAVRKRPTARKAAKG